MFSEIIAGNQSKLPCIIFKKMLVCSKITLIFSGLSIKFCTYFEYFFKSIISEILLTWLWHGGHNVVTNFSLVLTNREQVRTPLLKSFVYLAFFSTTYSKSLTRQLILAEDLRISKTDAFCVF